MNSNLYPPFPPSTSFPLIPVVSGTRTLATRVNAAARRCTSCFTWPDPFGSALTLLHLGPVVDDDGKPLPLPPPDDYADWSPPSDNASGRHNVPFVRLTSSEYVSSSEQETTRESTRPGSLYTITEMTEHTEDSRDWRPPSISLAPFHYPQAAGSRGTLMSSISTDYGQVIGTSHFFILVSPLSGCLAYRTAAIHPRSQ